MPFLPLYFFRYIIPFPSRILPFTVSCHWRLFQQQTNHTWPSLWNQRRATFVGKNSPWPLTLSERKTPSIWGLHNLSAYLDHQCSLSLLFSITPISSYDAASWSTPCYEAFYINMRKNSSFVNWQYSGGTRDRITCFISSSIVASC